MARARQADRLAEAFTRGGNGKDFDRVARDAQEEMTLAEFLVTQRSDLGLRLPADTDHVDVVGLGQDRLDQLAVGAIVRRRDKDEGQTRCRVVQVRANVADEPDPILDGPDVIPDVPRLEGSQGSQDIHLFRRLGVHRLTLGGRFGDQSDADPELA